MKNPYETLFDWYAIDEALEIAFKKVFDQVNRKMDQEQQKFLDEVITPFDERHNRRLEYERIETAMLEGAKAGEAIRNALIYLKKRMQIEFDLNYLDPSKFESGGYVSNAKIITDEYKSKKPNEHVILKDNGIFPNFFDHKNVNPN